MRCTPTHSPPTPAPSHGVSHASSLSGLLRVRVGGCACRAGGSRAGAGPGVTSLRPRGLPVGWQAEHSFNCSAQCPRGPASIPSYFPRMGSVGGTGSIRGPSAAPPSPSRNPSHLFLMGAAAEPGVGRWRGPLSWRACPGTLTPPPHPTGPHLVLCLLSAQPLGSLQSEEWGAGTFLAQPLLWLPARAIPCRPPHKDCMLGAPRAGQGRDACSPPQASGLPLALGEEGQRPDGVAQASGTPALGPLPVPSPGAKRGGGHKHVPGRGSRPQLPGFRGAH